MVSVFMSSPLMKLMCVGAISVGKRAARLFSTHRIPTRHVCRGDVSLVISSARGQVRAAWLAGAVGGFYLAHGCTVAANVPTVYHNTLEPLL